MSKPAMPEPPGLSWPDQVSGTLEVGDVVGNGSTLLVGGSASMVLAVAAVLIGVLLPKVMLAWLLINVPLVVPAFGLIVKWIDPTSGCVVTSKGRMTGVDVDREANGAIWGAASVSV